MSRVIGGFHKGRPLKTPKGLDTRPTTDRLKESLFGMIQFDLPNARFLDLFAGSGQIGIEALSRGASYCAFVEKGAEAAGCIAQNLQALGLSKSSRLLKTEVRDALRRLSRENERFDLIFMDPPYEKGLEEEIGLLIASLGLLAEEGVLIIESSSRTSVELAGMQRIREKTYKTTRFSFFQEAKELADS